MAEPSPQETTETETALPRKRTKPRRVRRLVEGFYDRIGIRPLGFIVFAASVVALLSIRGTAAYGPISAPAVATAPAVEHPAPVASHVLAVHVRPGAVVEEGALLATLAPGAIERELRLVDAEIVRLEAAGALARAELEEAQRARARNLGREVLDAARDVDRTSSRQTAGKAAARATSSIRDKTEEAVDARRLPATALTELELDARIATADAADASRIARAARDYAAALEAERDTLPAEHELIAPRHGLNQADLELLRVRRDHLRADLARMAVIAREPGRILEIAEIGRAVTAGSSVATLVPESAVEIVAYVPAETAPDRLVVGSEVAIVKPLAVCGDGATVLRRGASVTEAPPQIRGFFGRPVYGTPVYVSLPPACNLGVGQLLHVELTSL